MAKGRFRQARKLFGFCGFQPMVLVDSVRGILPFFADLRRYSSMQAPATLHVRLSNIYPILTDKRQSAGITKGHYFHQDLWAARRIFEKRPERHLDIGSRIDGFVAHVLSFMPVTLIDIRPPGKSPVRGLTFVQDDATELRKIDSDSVESLSTLHAAEHFGLGRYSDAVDPMACFTFMSTLERVLKPQGRLYFSVPIGHERVEFNAHRVFSVKTILQSFPRLKLVLFSYVDDDGNLFENVSVHDVPECEFACGLFEFTKPI